MKFGTQYKQGEIIIVPFPFSDLTVTKQRPVLIISKNSDNFSSDDIITCGLTSNLRDSRNSVLINNNDLEYGSIPTKSRIKVDKLFTLDKKIVKKKLAKINKTAFSKVKEEFLKLI